MRQHNNDNKNINNDCYQGNVSFDFKFNTFNITGKKKNKNMQNKYKLKIQLAEASLEIVNINNLIILTKIFVNKQIINK